MKGNERSDLDALLGEIDTIWDAFHFDAAYWARVVDLHSPDGTGGRWVEEGDQRPVYARPMFELRRTELDPAEEDDEAWAEGNEMQRVQFDPDYPEEFDNAHCWACDDNVWNGNHLLIRGLCKPCRETLLPSNQEHAES